MHVFLLTVYIIQLCLALFPVTCYSAVINSENGQTTGSKYFENSVISILEIKEIEKYSTQGTPGSFNGDNFPGKIFSSEESTSQEHKHNQKYISNESQDLSSEENIKITIRRKRSLDTKQEPVNAIGLNNTAAKENTSIEKGASTTKIVIPNPDSVESAFEGPENVNSTEYLASDKTSLLPESTTLETNLEVTTETSVETTTESNTEEITTETTTEKNPDKTIQSDLETTSAIQSTSIVPETTTVPSTVAATDDSDSFEIINSDGESQSVNSTLVAVESTKSNETNEESWMDLATMRVNKLSDQIRQVLSYYRKKGVVVLPSQNFFPDPMIMQDFRQSFSVGNMDFKNMRVFGLSNFTVEHINTDVDKMQVYILLHMKRLVILGNYTLRTFFSRSAGPFNVTLLDVDSEGVAEVQTAIEGHLEATDSEMDMFTKDMKIDFKNLGFMSSVVDTVGDALFNSIKPQILERVNLVIRTDVNKKLKEFSTKFINKVSPVDLAFSEGRRYAREHGYDPYKIRDHSFLIGGLMKINITQFWVEGLSKFYRVGNLSLSMDSGVIQVGVHVLTGKLKGGCVWSGETFGITKTGKTNFTVDHLQVRALVNQSLDVRKKPQLQDLDLELGWVKVTMNSPMTLNMMIEGIINAFPRLIRHIIVDTLEEPLKEKIQEILDKVNIESIVKENLPRLDSFGL